MATNDSAAEPLIGRDSEGQDFSSCVEAERRSGCWERDDDTGLTFGWFIWVLTFSAGVSGLLFGYDTGVISSTLVSIGTDLSSSGSELTTFDKSLITSSTSLFALLASPTAGYLADLLGRKKCILLADTLFVIGAICQALATSVAVMVAGRSIVGVAVGAASLVTPLYISELAPRMVRGRLVTINALLITGGQVVAYVVGWAYSGRSGGWRWMVGLGAVPAGVQILLLLSMPETPRWLIQRGLGQKAKEVLRRTYGPGSGGVVESILQNVQGEVGDERAARKVLTGDDNQNASVRDTLATLIKLGGNRRALTISCLLQSAQQLCGFNSLMYFSATIFAMVGFKNPIATSLTIACTNFIFTLITFGFIDRIGRRRMLLYSIPFMVLGLAFCAVAFRFIAMPAPANETSSRPSPTTTRTLSQTFPVQIGWPVIIVASMILYVASYALGLGCVPWQQSELFPLNVRGLGSGLATSTNWACNTLVGFTFLPMMALLTPTGTFAFYAAVCVAAWAGIFACYPETAGLGLEDVRGLLENGYGVKESIQAFRER